MHCNHDVFTQGIEQKRKIKLAFFSEKQGCNVVRLCAPLHYCEGQVEGDSLARYYFWNFETGKGKQFLYLPLSQVRKIELSEESFSVEEFTCNNKKGS